MRKPKRMNKKKSRSNFKKGAKNINQKNLPRTVQRGGIRL